MKKQTSTFRSVIGIGIMLLFFTSQVSAQTDSITKKWHYLAEPYIMFPQMQGETGIGSVLTVPVDASVSDIFGALKMGAMIYLEAHTDKWTISSDWVYMKLEQDITPSTLINSGTVGIQQSIWEVAGLYRLLPFLEVGAGGRLNYLQTNINAKVNAFPSGYNPAEGLHDATWFDPILITRLTTDIDEKWLFQFRGDLGGFGLGSHFTWQVQAYAGYRFSELFQLTAGYRLISTDYSKPTGYDEFIFDMNESGPVIRFGFNF